MMFSPIFRGFVLNQAQLDALVPLLNEEMNRPRSRSRAKLEEVADALFLAAGCEVNEASNERATPEMIAKADKLLRGSAK
ncbi:hypothetical protein QO021_29780 (plasmid) [Pseudomonas amygdali pv. lachrymans]|uniref:hypothetical protein n=1 Tax=Pseudomonas amygdali TaxID=47877 RepID=UPI000A6E9D1D|nr:hypothetical protein [Pseudomonas amygdali]RMM39434.1 hypothetical protein ALQ79_200580 [Pseudomonas amygdali pv. lachrymans]WIO61279.1 hypothetical protein QO021_29780 [Pseudomonas amygdali pv. lachrymans]